MSDDLEPTTAAFIGVPSLAENAKILEQSSRNAVKNKRRCHTLASGVSRLLQVIKDHQTKMSQSSLHEAVEQTNSLIREINKDVSEWGQYNIWTNWLREEETIAVVAGYDARLKDLSEKILRIVIMEMDNRVESAQQFLKGSGVDRAERQEAREKIYLLHDNTSLNGACVKVGTKAVVSGSSCTIWEGLWLERIPVALKFNPAYRADVQDEKTQMRFKRQVDIWRMFDSPYVLKLHGWVQMDDGNVCLVSPWMKNGDIIMYLSKEKQGTKELIRLITDIATGLQYLHKSGNLHGSLQPSNILVDDNGIPVLSDFALSKPISAGATYTQSNRHATDFRYHAPETEVDEPTSTANDVYSWGMTALEILSGKKPFAHIESPDILMEVIFEKGDLPKLSDHECPVFDTYPELWALLRSCWHRTKQTRPTLDTILQEITETDI